MGDVDAILWDNDGVLVDTEALYFRATREILATAGVLFTEADYTRFHLRSGSGAWHLAAERGATLPEIERMKASRDDLYSELLVGGSLVVDGVRETLERLRPRVAMMGIVTSSRRRHFDLIHRASGLLGYFDFVVAEGDYRRSKPDPEPYLVAVGRAGVPAGGCIAIEDSLRGHCAATAAGVRCLMVPSAFERHQDLPPAVELLDSVRDIPRLLFG